MTGYIFLVIGNRVRGGMDLDRMLKEGKEDYFIMAETLYIFLICFH